MGQDINRRDLLGSASAAMAAALAGPLSLPGPLEQILPAQVSALLPDEARGAAELIAELLRLEEEAKALRLPASALAFGSGGIPGDTSRLYEQVMPRLVALIDRSQARVPQLADKAAALLFRLHQTQYVAPDGWFQGSLMPALPSVDFPQTARPQRIATPLDGDLPAQPVLPGVVLAAPVAEPAVPDVPTVPLPGISASHRFDDISDEYAAWFGAAEIRPKHRESTDWHLTMMRQSRSRYAALGKQVGVPWQFIAAIHGLEASFNFRAHMHNGDYPLHQRTRQVPAGRPRAWLPPSSWEASALDALRLLGFTGQSDWSVPRMLHRLEAYNGFGYRHSKRASPYLWSFSTLYERGKFVADGRYDPKARSQQCGAAVMLKLLDLAGELD
ncbi:MAG: hypothetical protein ABL914_03715 [Novosphingobium sp.]|uniref:hypothetical protein n=1 Tax=Novosphingobium sp. TaxID=1874826 RepID=UPI0032BA8F7D